MKSLCMTTTKSIQLYVVPFPLLSIDNTSNGSLECPYSSL